MSKELACDADSKYIRFIKFVLPIKSYEPEKIYLILYDSINNQRVRKP